MQQHSQIIEQIKDRLVQALDEQSNVKDIHEVNRIIAVLEHTHVTREDLEKTRLGKYINELRRKTTDKELAKRAKKLIKSWRDLTVGGNGASNSSSALTSPFTNSNSIISPHNYSNDSNSLASYGGNSYAPSQTGVANNSNGSNGSSRGANAFFDSKSSSGPVNSNHPALARIRSQHITSPAERTTAKHFSQNSLSPSSPFSSKVSPVLSGGAKSLNGPFRPHSQTTSPLSKSNLSPSVKEPSSLNHHYQNGFKPSSNHHANHRNSRITPPNKNHNNLTSPVNSSINASSTTTTTTKANGHLSSPGLYNSFKNILSKDGTSRTISPNTFRQRNTPPTPNSSTNLRLSSSNNNPDSASSSRHCSPLAFTFTTDSRDSTSFSNKNSYSNQDEFSALDTNDEDSTSSVFSSISTGTGPVSGSNKPELGKKRGRKRKVESESDSLRENLNTIMNSGGGRRLQSTSELVQQKFNIKMNPNILQQQQQNSHSKYNSLSASSSPLTPVGGKHSPDPPSKRAKRSNGFDSVYQNGYHRHDDISLDDFKSAISHRNKSLPASPALSSLKNNSSQYNNHLVNIPSSAIQSPEDSYIDDDDVEYDDEFSQQYGDEDDDDDNNNTDSRNRYPIIKIKPLTGFGKLSKIEEEVDENLSTVTKVDEEIEKIYAKLPKVSLEDVNFMQQFKFDEDENNNQTELESIAKKEEEEDGDQIKSKDISETVVIEDQVDKAVKDSAICADYGDDSEYEQFAYNEVYEEEEDEEVEVTDDDDSSDYNDQEEDDKQSEHHHLKVTDDDDEPGGQSSPLHDVDQDDDDDDVDGSSSDEKEDHTLMGDNLKCDTISTIIRVGDDDSATDDDHCKSQSLYNNLTKQSGDSLTTTTTTTKDLSVEKKQSCSSTDEAAVSSSTCVESSQQEPDSTTTIVTDDDDDEEEPVFKLESSAHQPIHSDSDNKNDNAESDVPMIVSSSVKDSEQPDLADNNNWVELLGIDELYREDHCDDDILSRYTQQVFDFCVDSQQQQNDLSADISINTAPPPPPADDSLMETSTTTTILKSEQQQQQDMDISANSESISSESDNKPKRTKIIVRRVLRKKLRKCFVRSSVKKSLIDQMANEKWEFVNGTYDKDGVWHDFGEMTSALVLRNHPLVPAPSNNKSEAAATAGSEQAKESTEDSSIFNPDDDNVLHILPYVNYSW